MASVLSNLKCNLSPTLGLVKFGITCKKGAEQNSRTFFFLIRKSRTIQSNKIALQIFTANKTWQRNCSCQLPIMPSFFSSEASTSPSLPNPSSDMSCFAIKFLKKAK